MLAAIVFAATSGCAWQQLPSASFGPSGATAHRRSAERSKARVRAKLHLITERTGLPLSLGNSGANMHDSQGMEPLVRGIPPIRSRRGPRRRTPGKLHGDKGYNYRHLRQRLRSRGITHPLARRGIKSSTRPGRHRRVRLPGGGAAVDRYGREVGGIHTRTRSYIRVLCRAGRPGTPRSV